MTMTLRLPDRWLPAFANGGWLEYFPHAFMAGVLLAVWMRSVLLITWNFSPSVPGHLFYVIRGGEIHRGNVIAYRWHGDSHFPAGAIFLKFVGGVPGDVITVINRDYWVAGHHVGLAKTQLKDGEKLLATPAGVVPAGHLFLYGTHKDSFDSRYAMYGLADIEAVIGQAHALF